MEQTGNDLGKLVLEFMSPTALNKGEDASKQKWGYASIDGSELVLDSKSWNISCESNNASAKISDWVVDETSCTMKLKSDSETDGNFSELTYTFAVSMLGQIVEMESLIKYLISLKEQFNDAGHKPEEPSSESNE